MFCCQFPPVRGASGLALPVERTKVAHLLPSRCATASPRRISRCVSGSRHDQAWVAASCSLNAVVGHVVHTEDEALLAVLAGGAVGLLKSGFGPSPPWSAHSRIGPADGLIKPTILGYADREGCRDGTGTGKIQTVSVEEGR